MENRFLVWRPHRLANDEWKGRIRGGEQKLSMFFFGMVVCMVVNSRLRPLIPNWCAVQQHPLTSIDHQFAKKKLTYITEPCVLITLEIHCTMVPFS